MGRRARRSMALAAVLTAACGGEGRNLTGPRAPEAPVSGLTAGAALTVVSGATAAPLAGVTLAIGGQTVVTDAGGQARVPAAAPIGTLIDLTHPTHLDRQTSVRSDVGNRLTLWPRTTADGLDEHYTATIAYTAASDTPSSAVGTAPLYRLPQGTDTVVIVPSAELLADGASMEWHAAAVASATAASGGRVSFVLSPTASVGNGIVVTTRLDAADRQCAERNIRGYMQGRYGRFAIVSGEIVYCSPQAARSSTVVHEVGHAFGLQHAPVGTNDVMAPTFGARRATTFGPRESLVMRMMLDRTPGNRFPDSDRTVSASSAIEERRTVCQ
jgi:hypothetical protein